MPKVTITNMTFQGPVPGHPWPTIAFEFPLPGAGVWDLMEPAPFVVLEDGSQVRMTPALKHPFHTAVKTVTIEKQTTLIWVWDARLDGLDPSDETRARRRTYKWTWYNLSCQRTETPPEPPTYPPINGQEPPTPPNDPVEAPREPVEPIDPGNPIFINVNNPPTPPVVVVLEEEPETDWTDDVVVPEFPHDTVVTETSDLDQVPVTPTADLPVTTQTPPVVDQGGLSGGVGADVGADTPPEVITVPDSTYGATEPPALPQGDVSVSTSEQSGETLPGGEIGKDIALPNMQSGVYTLTPVPYNTYSAPLTDVDYSGATTDIGGNGTFHIFVAPNDYIPFGEPAVVSAVVQNTSGSDISNYGIVLEYEDELTNRTTIGVSEAGLVFPAGGNMGVSVTLETSYFEPGAGTIRAILISSSRVATALAERSVWINSAPDTPIDYREDTALPAMTVEEALGGTIFMKDAAFFKSGLDTTFYVKATATTAKFAMMLHPYTKLRNVIARLDFGDFDGGGAPQAATDSSTDPLRTATGINIAPGTHDVFLEVAGLTVGTWYYIRAVQVTNIWDSHLDFTIWGNGAYDPSLAPPEQASVPAEDLTEVTAVHPSESVSQLYVDGSGLLAGTIYLPYDEQMYMLVNDRTSEAIVTNAVNATDVQAESLTGNIVANVGDTIVVFRTGQSTNPELVARLEVEETL